MTAPATTPPSSAGFEHEALFYRDDETFLAGLLPFVRAGLAQGEDVLVAEPAERAVVLPEGLGADAAAVRWLDVAVAAANPARLIAVWAAARDAAAAAGRRLRGVGESSWPGRHEAEYTECRLHELLMNTAFDGGPPWRLLCPYDQARLPRAVRTGALQSHPVVTTPEHRRPSTAFHREAAAAAFDAPLHQPADGVLRGSYGPHDVQATRRTVASFARSVGLPPDRARTLELTASELVANSLRHGGGSGTVALWATGDAAVVEFRDGGRITDPLVGRLAPRPDEPAGHGLYAVNQLCDLVQVRSSAEGTTVRVTTWR